MVTTMAATLTVGLTEGYTLGTTQAETIELRCPPRVLRLKGLDPGVGAALRRLADGRAAIAELEKLAATEYPGADLDRLHEELVRLVGKTAVSVACTVAGVELMRAKARSPLADFDLSLTEPAGPVCLSRFAYARRADGGLILESPVSHVSVRVREPAIGELLARLASPCAVAELPDRFSGLPSGAVGTAVAFLHGVGLLVAVDAHGVPDDEGRPALVQREFHDVLAHASGRRGLTDRPVGGTFRFEDILPPQPAIRDLPPGTRIALPRPDLDRVEAADPPLLRAMESRRSVRTHGDRVLTAAELGEFLFRVARSVKVYGIDRAAGAAYETGRRPYPSGGACYDLELYVTTRVAAGLPPGVYHYDPAGHQLTQVCGTPETARRMLLEACLSAAVLREPQVLITLASRFARLSWKYEAIAYATTLKNVGVLYQSMYLVATAMGLAPCALGGGDSALFCTATGLDPLVESSVGEFMLGTRPEAAK
jgi:oxazoline/thiazoline dehydrogenase